MPTTQRKIEDRNELMQLILKSIESLEYGQVLITVHGSKVVQVEKVERTRLDLKSQMEHGGGI
jgi:hypothetical protein